MNASDVLVETLMDWGVEAMKEWHEVMLQRATRMDGSFRRE